jgi:hypothetical protein
MTNNKPPKRNLLILAIPIVLQNKKNFYFNEPGLSVREKRLKPPIEKTTLRGLKMVIFGEPLSLESPPKEIYNYF